MKSTCKKSIERKGRAGKSMELSKGHGWVGGSQGYTNDFGQTESCLAPSADGDLRNSKSGSVVRCYGGFCVYTQDN